MARLRALLVVACASLLTSTMTACDSTPPSLPTDNSPAAVTALLTGSGGQDFLDSISTHDWPDGGAEAGAVFGWIASDATSADPSTARRAGESAVSIARYLSSRGDELLDLKSGWFGTSRTTLGGQNPDLTRDFATSLVPFLAPIVCDSRGTSGFELLDPAGCDESVQAAKPVFTVLNTDRQAGEQLTAAANSAADRQIQQYADANPADLADPARGGLRYAGRLLGLAAVGAQRSGVATRPLSDVVREASYVIAKAAIARGQGTMWPEFMTGDRLMSPDEARAQRGATRMDEYYGALDNYVRAIGAYRALDDQLRGEYEKVTGHQ